MFNTENSVSLSEAIRLHSSLVLSSKTSSVGFTASGSRYAFLQVVFFMRDMIGYCLILKDFWLENELCWEEGL